jgi:two-component system sensor histidine kinase KdpD
LDALWVRKPGQELTEEQKVVLAALRRLASILGAHFIEEEGEELVTTVRRVVVERGTTYVLLGTPDESRRKEILRGSLVSALVRTLPGVDVRVIANRANRRELAG